MQKRQAQSLIFKELRQKRENSVKLILIHVTLFHIEKIQQDPGFVKLERILSKSEEKTKMEENKRQKSSLGLIQQPIVKLEKISKFDDSAGGTKIVAVKVELDESKPDDFGKPKKRTMVSLNFL